MRPSRLTASDLSIVRPQEGLRIVEGVDLNVAPGERVGLVGESGSGKSLTVRALVGLLRPPAWRVEGRIELDGIDLLAAPPAVWQAVRGGRIGLVFQEPASALNPVLRVKTQIGEGLSRLDRRARRIRALELLRELQLQKPEWCLKAYPHQLSGGMRQRVALAMALAQDPGLLLADEPTTALDAPLAAEVLNILDRRVEQRGMALLLVAHDLAIVGQRTHRTAVMYAGELVETGPTERLLTRPAHPYTQCLLRAAPRLDGNPSEPIPGRMPPPGKRPTGCRFEPRCPRRQARCREVHPTLLQIGDMGNRRVRCLFPLHDPEGTPSALAEVPTSR